MAKTATTSSMNPLPSLIRASAWDAGNAHMAKAGRKIWSRADYSAAGDEQERLLRACYERAADTDPREAYCRFGYAEAMEKAGMLTVYTKRFHEVLDASYAAYVASLQQEAA
jgi:hypothetical protein